MSVRAKRKQETREALKQAVLDQSVAGQSFSAMSLRQITKIAGVVPATFYRHFEDMEDLGLKLINESLTLILKNLHAHLALQNDREGTQKIADSVELFFRVIDDHPDLWLFVVTERWGGSASLRAELKKHFEVMVHLIAVDLAKQETLKGLNKEDTAILADMTVNLFCNWIMSWLALKNSLTNEADTAPLVRHKKVCTKQIKLLFYGVVNWRSETKEC